MLISRSLLLLCIFFVLTSDLRPEVIHVGPSRIYKSLQEVESLVDPGDTVLVDGNTTYPGGINFTRSGLPDLPIVIKGIKIAGKRPVLEGGANTIQFSTWPYDSPGADHYILEGFEIVGGTQRGVFHQAHDLTLRDCIVRDCPQQGILGADEGSGSLTLEFVEVYNCGSGIYQHQIYVATDQVNHPGSILRIQFCYIHDANGGNNLKSRAERNEIYYNWFENAYYHEIELIGPEVSPAELNREDSDVVGNVFWDRNDFYIARIGGDGTGETNGRYRFVNNTFIGNSQAIIRLFDGVESIEMHNNIFFRAGNGSPRIFSTSNVNWTNGFSVISGKNNWVETGSQDVPTEWEGTVISDNPGLQSIEFSQLYPLQESLLTNGGTPSPVTSGQYTFPNPHRPAIYEPVNPSMRDSLYRVVRPIDNQIDIGAFESKVINNIGHNEYINQNYVLFQSYPNPFNPKTQIPFMVFRPGHVRLTIMDINGRDIRILLDKYVSKGKYQVVWDGRDNFGHDTASGIYIYRFSFDDASEIGRLVKIK